MTYASVCSGIEAATVAWHDLGFKPVWFSQFDPEHNYKRGHDFASRVLATRFPEVPNLGDMTKLQENEIYRNSKFDLLVGGTPCQDFSIAGLRQGLDGERSNLALDFIRILRDKMVRLGKRTGSAYFRKRQRHQDSRTGLCVFVIGVHRTTNQYTAIYN